MSRGKHFSPEELEFIKVNALVMNTQQIASALGRNYWSIHRQLQSLGVKKNHSFTPNEDFIIKQMYGRYSAKVIATKLGIDEEAVYNRVKKLKLRKNNRKK